ncbi:peptide deformylase-like [Schistocerca gregaria]|uniref:peptide deformylase-like n=1 Tax=Schistocerca gregaria TaxID=7010 RepID=UPI00211DFE3F|nr:peptide deformylase-like [Schistocerca gregaria]
MGTLGPRGVLNILRMGHPVLKKHAESFKVEEIKSPQTRHLVQDMKETLYKNRAVGLAAPQIGVSKQLLVFTVPEGVPNLTHVPLTVLFNPKMEFVLKHEIIQMTESCLSVPDWVGKVPRYNNVIINYLDEESQPKRLVATGFVSGILQHEVDHLSGTLYLERLKSVKDLAYKEEWSDHMAEDPTVCWSGTIKFCD